MTQEVASQNNGRASAPVQTVFLEDYIETMYFSGTGEALFGAQTHNVVSTWRVFGNQIEPKFSFHSGPKRLYDISLSPDGAMLATVGLPLAAQASLLTWSVPSGTREKECFFPDSYLLATAFSPDGMRLLAAGSQEKLHVINLRTDSVEFAAIDEVEDEEFWGLGERNTSIVYHPDHRTVLITACGQGGSAVVFCELDAERSTLTPRSDLTLPLPYDVLTPAAFSPDGSLFAFADWNVNLYSFPSRKRVATFDVEGLRAPMPAAEPVVRRSWSNVLFTPNGRTLICGSPDGGIYLWDVPNRLLRESLAGHKGGVLALALNPTGTLLASSGRDKTLRLWEIAGS